MKRAVLAINAGSSSIKIGLFEEGGDGRPVLLASGLAEDGKQERSLTLTMPGGAVLASAGLPDEDNRGSLYEALFDAVERQVGKNALIAVGHRVVHGGRDYSAPARIDQEVLAALELLTPLAPLHQPRCLEPIQAIAKLRPDLPQIACFDTAFHHALEPPVSRYAIPRSFEAQGIRKYGFHGISYEGIAGQLRDILPERAAGRVVVAHLGNGASLCAMRDGRSVDTTMGFSVLDGLMMGTRCGALDPGVVIYLQKSLGLDVDEVEDLLYHRSGLLGVSDISSDMRILMASADPRANEAIELFVFRVAQQVSTMAHALGGIDTLVFTGGIGQHMPKIRARIGGKLGWLGVGVDMRRNEAAAGDHTTDIGPDGTGVRLLVIPAQEESVIAAHTLMRLGR